MALVTTDNGLYGWIDNETQLKDVARFLGEKVQANLGRKYVLMYFPSAVPLMRDGDVVDDKNVCLRPRAVCLVVGSWVELEVQNTSHTRRP